MQTRLYLNRWLTFVASCLMQASAGLSYSFSIYAPALKEIWGYHETQIATVGSCFNIGGYLAIPSGALYDRLERHKRFGPRFVPLIGVITLCAGYLGLYAAASGLVTPSFALVCACAVLGGNSSTWFDTTSIVTNVRNFPHDRGTVVGILKAFVGLSASIYSSIYAASFATAPGGPAAGALRFLLFVGTVPPLLALALITLVNLVPEAYHEPQPPEQQQQQLQTGRLQPSQQQQQQQRLDGSRSGRQARAAARRNGEQLEAAEPLLGAIGAPEEPPQLPQLLSQPPQVTSWALSRRPAVSRYSTQARFTFTYCLVALVATYQTGAALWAGAAHPTPIARRELLGGLLALLAVLLLVPVASGDCVHRKPRPEAVERARKSLLARLVSASLRRGRRESGRALAAVAAAAAAAAAAVAAARPVAAVATEGREVRPDLEEPLLLTEAPSEGDGQAVVTAAARTGVVVGAGAAALPLEGAVAPHVVITSAVLLPVPPPAGGPTAGEAGPEDAAAAVAASTAPPAARVRDRDMEAALESLEKVPALPDLSLGAAAKTPLFWLLLFQFSVGLGTGLSFLNNLGSIVVSLGGEPGGQVVFVSLFSVANATGRLMGGVLSEHVLRRYGTPRTLILLGVSCLTLCGVGGAMASELGDLYFVSVVAGLAFGAHWGLIPAITSDLFGLTHFGSNYTGLQLGPAVGGYLLATVLTGKLYDRAARRHGDTLFCIGADCYFETWCVLGGLNLVALLCTRELYAMSARHYKRIVRGGGV